MSDENVSLDKKSQKQFLRRSENVKRKVKTGKIKIKENRTAKRRHDNTGIVLLRHIPHGFYENEIKGYFSQFGKVLNVYVCRSMRTGRSKGYAFVRFADKEVAKIAAETMDNYLMFQKLLSAKYLEPSEVPSRIFKQKPISEENIPIKAIREKMNKKKNASISEQKYKSKCKKKLLKINKISKKLSEIGIDYSIEVKDAPVFIKEEIEKSKKETDNKQDLNTSDKDQKRKPATKKMENKLNKTSAKEKIFRSFEEADSPDLNKSKKGQKQKPAMKKTENKSNKTPTKKKVSKSFEETSSPEIATKKREKSLKSISKAKVKVTKNKSNKEDVKKLKSALEEYMKNNFGKSKPKLRSAQKKSKSVVVF